MSESHPEHAPVRARTLLVMPVGCSCDGDHEDDDETLVVVEHVYLAEGEAGTCGGCGHLHHDPGLVCLVVGEDSVLLTDQEALKLAHRLIKGADLIAEAAEDPPDIERDMARFAVAARTEEGS